MVRITADNGIVVIDDGRGIPTGHQQGPGSAGRHGRAHEAARRREVQQGRLQGQRRPARRRRQRRERAFRGLRGRGLPERVTSTSRRSHAAFPSARWSAGARPIARVRRSSSSRTARSSVSTRSTPTCWPSRFRELAFLNRGVLDPFRRRARRPSLEKEFTADGGIQEFVRAPERRAATLHDDVIYVEAEQDDVHRRDRGAVPRRLQREHPGVRQQHPDARGRNARVGVPHGADAQPDELREAAEPLQGDGPSVRRGLPRGLHGRHLASRCPSRSSRGRRRRSSGNSEVDGIVNSIWGEALKTYLEEHPKNAKSDPRQGHPGVPGAGGGAQGAGSRATQGCAVRRRDFPGSWRTARVATSERRRSSSSRASRPAGPPRWDATASTRRSFRSRGRS